MGSRGRKSTAALTVAQPGIRAVVPRVAPPATLAPAEAAAWLSATNSLPADWFGEESRPLLERYAKHCARAAELEARLTELDPVFHDETYARLARLLQGETGRILALARAMRLTQQARLKAETAASKADRARGSSTHRPWQWRSGK